MGRRGHVQRMRTSSNLGPDDLLSLRNTSAEVHAFNDRVGVTLEV